MLLEAQKKVEDDNEEGAQKEDTEEPKMSERADESKLKEAIKEKIKKSIKDSLGSEIPTINIKEKDEEVTKSNFNSKTFDNISILGTKISNFFHSEKHESWIENNINFSNRYYSLNIYKKFLYQSSKERKK